MLSSRDGFQTTRKPPHAGPVSSTSPPSTCSVCLPISANTAPEPSGSCHWSDAAQASSKEDLVWLHDADIGERLHELRRDPCATRRAGDHSQVSVAGAQPKTALLLRHGRWGVPAGQTPNTHIPKPPSDAFDGHAENEHFSLALNRRLELPVALSKLRQLDGEAALVVPRVDRIERGGRLLRGHQQDRRSNENLPASPCQLAASARKMSEVCPRQVMWKS
jgi:hypothetical protein